MRSVFALVPAPVLVVGSLLAGVSANAATVHRSRAHAHVPFDASQGAMAPNVSAGTGRFAVPGWSDDSTRRWLDNASALAGSGGG